MIRRLLTRLSNRLRARCIDVDGAPYMFRYYIGKLFGVTFYLHEFVRADSERWLHDHPWRLSVSLVLAGSYIEERMMHLDPANGPVVALRRVRWLNIITGGAAHRVAKPVPGTWTLFCHTKRAKSWGFYEHAAHAVLFPANDNEPTRSVVGGAVIYHQPFEVAASKGWHTRAARGAELKREIYGTE